MEKFFFYFSDGVFQKNPDKTAHYYFFNIIGKNLKKPNWSGFFYKARVFANPDLSI